MVDDIYDIWEPAWWQSPWNVAYGICALLVFFLIMFLFSRRYKTLHTKQDVSPLVESYKRLMVLLEQFPAAHKEIYQHITFIVRHILEKEYGALFIYGTDEEIIEYLDDQEQNENFRKGLILLFKRGSLVKFAGARVQDEDLSRDADLVRSLYEKYPLDTSGRLRDTRKKQIQA